MKTPLPLSIWKLQSRCWRANILLSILDNTFLSEVITSFFTFICFFFLLYQWVYSKIIFFPSLLGKGFTILRCDLQVNPALLKEGQPVNNVDRKERRWLIESI